MLPCQLPFLRLFLSFLLTFFPTSFAARRLSHFLNLGTHALSQVSITPVPGYKYNFFCRTSSCPATRYSPFSWLTCGQSQVVLLCRRMVSPFFKSIRPFSKTRCTLPWIIRSPPLRSVDWSCTLSTVDKLNGECLLKAKWDTKAYVYFKL